MNDDNLNTISELYKNIEALDKNLSETVPEFKEAKEITSVKAEVERMITYTIGAYASNSHPFLVNERSIESPSLSEKRHNTSEIGSFLKSDISTLNYKKKYNLDDVLAGYKGVLKTSPSLRTSPDIYQSDSKFY